MAINFNSLPSNRPTNLPPTGTYYAVIESAEMRQGQDPTKPPYLNMCLALKDKSGRAVGKIYDILSESDKELVQYKLARFLMALDLAKLGTFELADLAKLIKNKQLIVDVKQEESQNGYPAKAVVDVFKNMIYYPMSEASVIFNIPQETAQETAVQNAPWDVPTTDELTINASDAVDVHATDLDDF